jgi:hypothetical protein
MPPRTESIGKHFEGKDIILFSRFDGVDTQSDRHDLPKEKAAWLENIQPIGPNNNLCVPGPANAIATLTGKTITKQWYFNYGLNTDYTLNFCSDGSATAARNPGGAKTTIAAPGTFSSLPDVTNWATQRALIADPTAGYCSWDPVAGLVVSGGVSPNTQVTNGGSLYAGGATVTYATSGSGTGATFTATVVGGVVTSVNLTNPGTGFAAGDTVTLTIHAVAGGSGATATAHVWPFLTSVVTTLAVFDGRVWIGAANMLIWTGTGATYNGVGYDDFLTADAAGSSIVNDPSLVHRITALRALNNYLFQFGDNSVTQIGNITVSGSTTSFSSTQLSSDQGTTFPDSVVSFNRLVLFGNTVGVFALFGSSVEKISDALDGVFRRIDFSQPLKGAVNDLNNIHTFLLLVKYNDPMSGARGLILGYMNKKWFFISQGDSLVSIFTAIINGTTDTFSSSGDDITEILADPNAPVDIILSTSLTSHETPFESKKTVRYATVQTLGAQNQLSLLIESERMSEGNSYSATNFIQFTGLGGMPIQFTGSGGAYLNFSSGNIFLYDTGNTQGVSGIYLGATLTGTVTMFSLNNIMLEYGITAPFAAQKTSISQA